jgi:hypothetical protein
LLWDGGTWRCNNNNFEYGGSYSEALQVAHEGVEDARVEIFSQQNPDYA